MAAPAPVDFWFSFGSPPAYLAEARIEAIAGRHGRTVRFRPYNVCAAFEAEGLRPNILYDRKGPNTRRDWERTARLRGIAFRMPDPFGRSSLPAMTAFYGLEAAEGHALAAAFARVVNQADFIDNRAIDEPETLAAVGREHGLGGERVAALAEDPDARRARGGDRRGAPRRRVRLAVHGRRRRAVLGRGLRSTRSTPGSPVAAGERARRDGCGLTAPARSGIAFLPRSGLADRPARKAHPP